MPDSPTPCPQSKQVSLQDPPSSSCEMLAYPRGQAQARPAPRSHPPSGHGSVDPGSAGRGEGKGPQEVLGTRGWCHPPPAPTGSSAWSPVMPQHHPAPSWPPVAWSVHELAGRPGRISAGKAQLLFALSHPAAQFEQEHVPAPSLCPKLAPQKDRARGSEPGS